MHRQAGRTEKAHLHVRFVASMRETQKRLQRTPQKRLRRHPLLRLLPALARLMPLVWMPSKGPIAAIAHP